MTSLSWPVLGCGVGLRNEHYDLITREWPKMDWFEAISENFMDSGGRPLRILEEVRRHYPVALHGVSLSIGSVDPLQETYLKRLKALIDRIDPAIVSDHLCWTGVDDEQLHDLLPLPFTEEAIRHVVNRVEYVQEFLDRRILLENVSAYVTYRHSTMPEWEFLAKVAKRSDCGILLDLNNIYVNSINHEFDPYEYLNHIPGERVGQFHLAGHRDMGAYLFDTHDHPVIEKVWDLYRYALKLWGPISTLIEWDDHIPEFSRLAEEAATARAIFSQTSKAQSARELKISQKKSPSRLTQSKDIPLLADLQRWFKAKMMSNGEQITSHQLATPLNPQGGAPGLERILVYARGYIARIEEALREVYEAVHHVLGHGNFHKLSEAYAHEYPSRYYNLSTVGKHLPEFLPGWPYTKEWPFLPDLAKLEWLIAQAFHAFDKPPLDASRFSSLSLEQWEEAKFLFQPSVGLISSPWPILDIWETRTQPIEEVDIDLINRPQHILVARRGVQVRCAVIDERQYQLLEGLLKGNSLGTVCDQLADVVVEGPLPIADWFSSWRKGGLIYDCSLPTKDCRCVFTNKDERSFQHESDELSQRKED